VLQLPDGTQTAPLQTVQVGRWSDHMLCGVTWEKCAYARPLTRTFGPKRFGLDLPPGDVEMRGATPERRECGATFRGLGKS